jgi:hypothetical protein
MIFLYLNIQTCSCHIWKSLHTHEICKFTHLWRTKKWAGQNMNRYIKRFFTHHEQADKWVCWQMAITLYVTVYTCQKDVTYYLCNNNKYTYIYIYLFYFINNLLYINVIFNIYMSYNTVKKGRFRYNLFKSIKHGSFNQSINLFPQILHKQTFTGWKPSQSK